jgi:hypothetical protein
MRRNEQRSGSSRQNVLTMEPQFNPYHDDMPAETDFSEGTRGKFFRPDARISQPVYLEAEVQAYLTARAKARGIEVGQLVNELLKKDIELIEGAR